MEQAYPRPGHREKVSNRLTTNEEPQSAVTCAIHLAGMCVACSRKTAVGEGVTAQRRGDEEVWALGLGSHRAGFSNKTMEST